MRSYVERYEEVHFQGVLRCLLHVLVCMFCPCACMPLPVVWELCGALCSTCVPHIHFGVCTLCFKNFNCVGSCYALRVVNIFVPGKDDPCGDLSEPHGAH